MLRQTSYEELGNVPLNGQQQERQLGILNFLQKDRYRRGVSKFTEQNKLLILHKIYVSCIVC